jgi:dehydrogenase/reductase SDR family protein 13
MQGKNIIITGANTGIGLDSAVELASMGATVVMACRDEKRATAALAEVRRRSGSQTVEYMQLDLSDLDSVRKSVAACCAAGSG